MKWFYNILYIPAVVGFLAPQVRSFRWRRPHDVRVFLQMPGKEQVGAEYPGVLRQIADRYVEVSALLEIALWTIQRVIKCQKRLYIQNIIYKLY